MSLAISQRSQGSRRSLDPTAKKSLIIALYAIQGCLVFFLALQVMVPLYQIGGNSAQSNILNARQIEFVSNSPQALGTPIIVAAGTDGKTSSLYVYQGFRLLTYNTGKYYFFDEIDPVTCKPSQVFIADETQFTQVSISPAPTAPFQCIESADYISITPQVAVTTTSAP